MKKNAGTATLATPSDNSLPNQNDGSAVSLLKPVWMKTIKAANGNLKNDSVLLVRLSRERLIIIFKVMIYGRFCKFSGQSFLRMAKVCEHKHKIAEA